MYNKLFVPLQHSVEMVYFWIIFWYTFTLSFTKEETHWKSAGFKDSWRRGRFRMRTDEERQWQTFLFSGSYKFPANHFASIFIFLYPFGGTSWLSQLFDVPSPPKSVGTPAEPSFSRTKVSKIVEIRKWYKLNFQWGRTLKEVQVR